MTVRTTRCVDVNHTTSLPTGRHLYQNCNLMEVKIKKIKSYWTNKIVAINFSHYPHTFYGSQRLLLTLNIMSVSVGLTCWGLTSPALGPEDMGKGGRPLFLCSLHPSCVMCKPTVGEHKASVSRNSYQNSKYVLGQLSVWRWSHRPSGRSSVIFHPEALGSRGGFWNTVWCALSTPPLQLPATSWRPSAWNFRVGWKLCVH